MPRKIIADVMDYESFMYACVWISLCHLSGKTMGNHFNLISVSVCFVCVCAMWSVSACPQTQTYGPLQCFSFPVVHARLAGSRSNAGGRDEPQLLSDVNAAQMPCLCGHSPSDSSNQLMGYLTLPASPNNLLLQCCWTFWWMSQSSPSSCWKPIDDRSGKQ